MPSTTPNSLSQKINQAFEIVKQSSFFGPDYTVEAFTEALAKMGGTSVEMLADATWEDFEDGLKVPRLIARKLANIFRSEDTRWAADADAKTIRVHKPMTDWPVELVLADLDPTKPKSPECQELVRRFGARPILVFDANGVFDLAATRAMIERAEKDEPETDVFSYPGGSGVVAVYAAGFGPFRLKDACPFHPDTPLVDGRCYKCQAEWGGLAKEVRQAIFYVGKSGFIAGDNRAQVHELFDKMVALSGALVQMVWLGNMYPEAMKAFNEAKAHGVLVPLVLDLGVNGSAKKNNPFGNKAF
jgi:hypothetical protein